MIQEDSDRESNQPIKKNFRHIRRGPLDAYIYKQGGDQENVEETQENMFVPSVPFTESRELPPPSIHLSDANKTHIFTDGACTNNGKRNANAAWGLVVVADSDHRVLYTESGQIPKSEPQTNQRAELQGLLKGLRQAKKFHELYPGHVTLWSDSQYAINCASVWGPKWRANGWKKQGGPIQHFDLVRDLVMETVEMGHRVSYRWLKAHTSGSNQYEFPWKFNHQVDALATAALA
jgi:ribonuclease HI